VQDGSVQQSGVQRIPMTISSPIFLKPLILRALRARKIKGFRKIGKDVE